MIELVYISKLDFLSEVRARRQKLTADAPVVKESVFVSIHGEKIDLNLQQALIRQSDERAKNISENR